jgi:transcriptional regulator with XRE-family HTH domain
LLILNSYAIYGIYKEAFMELGSKLKALRKANGMSLKDLSVATENQISVSFLSDIENGRSNPSIDSLRIIADVLNTSMSYFVEDSNTSLFGGAIEDVDFIPIMELLKDFSAWDLDDKKELLYYLKAKKTIREDR